MQARPGSERTRPAQQFTTSSDILTTRSVPSAVQQRVGGHVCEVLGAACANMDESARNEYELKSKQLRAELKGWESEWASRHDGNKPGRDDIKRNADIGESINLRNLPLHTLC